MHSHAAGWTALILNNNSNNNNNYYNVNSRVGNIFTLEGSNKSKCNSSGIRSFRIIYARSERANPIVHSTETLKMLSHIKL
jgi:hypothetical protein